LSGDKQLTGTDREIRASGSIEVQTSFPDEAMEIRQQLLNESPYLSDTIMKSAINQENVLPNAMIRDILVANPQSAKTPDVIQTLDNRFNPMPEYMMGEIMAGINTIGAREQIEQKLAIHKTKRMNSLSKLERFYISDTNDISTSTDSLIALWYREPFPDGWYNLLFMYFENSDSVNLFNILNSIPLNFELSIKEQAIHQHYEDLLEVLWAFRADSTNSDSSMIQSLLSISTLASVPGKIAKNRLINDNIITYNEPVYLPVFLKIAPFYPANSRSEDNEYLMKIFPNPADDYFILEYDLSENIETSYILVFNIMGKKYDLIFLENTHTQKIISSSKYSSGMYLIQLYIGNALITTEKIVISK